MIHFSFLSGAYKNAGDFLIVERSKALLRHVYPDCQITEYERRLPLNEHLEGINKSSCVILAGGPAYQPNIYPASIPLVENLDDIKAPIFSIGLGWKGRTINDIGNYHFSDTTKLLLQRIENDGLPLSCRDWNSAAVLHRNGFNNTRMTGCPAWYNLEYLANGNAITKDSPKEYKNICISDPAYIENHQQSIDLIHTIRRLFPQAEVTFVFHRGFVTDQHTKSKEGELQHQLMQKISEIEGVQIVDASYGLEKLKVYDACDLHIGFRVHAHIYNISQGNNSILIEEDARGAGINEITGHPSIKAYSTKYTAVKRMNPFSAPRIDVQRTQNPNFLQEVEFALFRMQESAPMLRNHTDQVIRNYFDVMTNHIKQIENLV